VGIATKKEGGIGYAGKKIKEKGRQSVKKVSRRVRLTFDKGGCDPWGLSQSGGQEGLKGDRERGLNAFLKTYYNAV